MTALTTLSRRSFLVMPLALAACKLPNQVIEITGFSMGTSYNIVAVDPTKSLGKAELQAAITAALADVNGAMSNWDDSSEISRFNAGKAGQAIAPTPELAHVLAAAEAVHRASDGRFDTTIGPLIELWGFGAPDGHGLPSDAEIAAAQARSGLGRTVALQGGRLEKLESGSQIYLAGIGKGFGADHIGRALEGLGLTDYLVEIGGDLYAAGRNPEGQPWQIGIEAPHAADRSVLDVVSISGLGLATSGDYRNFFEAGGQRYSHLIDPATGRPVTHKTASATVLADNAMLADAWSTAMHVLGRGAGLKIADREGIAVQFIDHDPAAPQLRFKTTTSAAWDRLTA